MPRRSSERMNPVSSSRVRDSTSGPAGLTFDATTSASTAFALKASAISASSCSCRSALDLGAELGDRVELAGGARELVVQVGQQLPPDLLDRDLGRGGRVVGELVGDALRLAHRRADERGFHLFDESSRAELDDGVALCLAVGRDDVDDEGVADLSRAFVGRHELCDRLAQRFELLRDQLLGHLCVRLAHLEGRPVDDVDLRLHGNRGRELPGRLILGRQLVVELGLRDRPDPSAGGRVPEPAGDVAVDGLGVDALHAEALLQDRDRHLAGPEAGNLDRRREIGGGVLDRVVDVVRRHVHREADCVAAELLDLGRHWVIQAEAVRAESSSRASSPTRRSISSRISRTRSSGFPAGSSRPQST